MRKFLRQTKTAARTARGMMPSNELFDITVEFVFETPRAIQYDNGKQKFWVPKSALGDDGGIQVENNSDGTITLTAPANWLREKGLI